MHQCPICKTELFKKERQYQCQNSHSFDIHKSGYVNLLQSQRSSDKQRGDNQQMVNARTAFLEEDAYSFLCSELIAIIKNYPGNGLDIGCGEGYYTTKIKNEFMKMNIFGVDISKEAILKSAKRSKEINWIVGSNSNLPILSESIDVSWSVFSPFYEDEIIRVLKKEGIFIQVYPEENHLLELKNRLYDEVYLNEPPIKLSKMLLLEERKIERVTVLESSQEIMNLLMMTPYAYRTDKSKIVQLEVEDRLEITFSFGLRIYQKID